MNWQGSASLLALVCLAGTPDRPVSAASAHESLDTAAHHPSSIQAADQISFSAHYQHRHEASETVLDNARLLVSSQGLRVDQQLNGAHNTFIANFQEDRFWFIDRQRSLSHEIPVEVVPEWQQDQSDKAENPDDSKGLSSGFVQFSPCQGFTAIEQGRTLWRGRELQVWQCSYQGKKIETQWYDTYVGVVVRVMSEEGFISELTELHVRSVSPEQFRPPASYRSVTLAEFMASPGPLKRYELSGESQN